MQGLQLAYSREFAALVRLRHPNICMLLGVAMAGCLLRTRLGGNIAWGSKGSE
jgi:hypothetical protein